MRHRLTLVVVAQCMTDVSTELEDVQCGAVPRVHGHAIPIPRVEMRRHRPYDGSISIPGFTVAEDRWPGSRDFSIPPEFADDRDTLTETIDRGAHQGAWRAGCGRCSIAHEASHEVTQVTHGSQIRAEAPDRMASLARRGNREWPSGHAPSTCRPSERDSPV